MNRISLLAAIAPLLLLGTAVPALAHGRIGHAGPPPISGTVTLAGSTKLQLSTVTGVVTVGLTADTHVVRVVSGSTADLHPNQLVSMHLVPGTTTIVDAIRIKGMGKAPATHAPILHRGTLAVKSDFMVTSGDSGRPHGSPGVPTRVDGQVVTLGTNTITIRTGSSKSTYTISGSVTVTKLLAGSLDDLAIGEMVQVSRGRDGDALTVTILSA